MRLVWSPRALADLDAIRAYISIDSPLHADLVVRRLVAAPERLRRFPESGRSVPEVGEPALRELVVRPYRLVYRVRSDVVEVVAIFRASRLFPGDAR
jgi:toxin ParE1/3/4